MNKTKPIIYSFSRTKTYDQCPYRFMQEAWLGNFKSEQHPAAERGNRMHEAFEQALERDEDLPGPYSEYEWVMDEVRKHPGLKIAEQSVGIDRYWRVCDFWDSNCWYRGKLDVTILNGDHATLIDYKTGKHRLDVRQASDYSLLLFLHYPHIENITFTFLWTDAGVDADTVHFNRDRDAQRMMDSIMRIPTQIETSRENDDWPKIKSGLCPYCPVVSCPNWSAPRK